MDAQPPFFKVPFWLTLLLGLGFLCAPAAAASGLTAEHVATAEFASHLPIIILTAEGLEAESGRHRARLRLLNGPGTHRLADRPTADLAVWFTQAENDGEHRSFHWYDKKLRLEIQAAEGERFALLELPESGHWRLEGSERDPAMLRNYLAYTLGREVLEGQAPQTRWCEVFWETEGGMLYQGLHLLSEFSTSAEAVVAARYVPSPEGGNVTPLGDKNRTGVGMAELEAAFQRARGLVTSNDPETYFGYQKALEVESFINTGLLNEALMNAPEGGPTVTITLTPGGRLRLSPDWNFDAALRSDFKARRSAGAAPNSLWLPELLQNEDFLRQYRDRYYRLYRGALNPRRLGALVDETILFLGPALARDWQRWKQTYTAFPPANLGNEKKLDPALRTWDENIVNVQYLLREQSQSIRLDLQQRRWQPDLLDASSRTRRNAILSALFIAAFFAVVALARKNY